jgi:hypothetical protein
MALVIRPADLALDKELIIDTLFQYLTPLSDARRFDWLYRGNPHGQARTWIAIDTDNHTPVGMASAFPRRFSIGGREELGWVLGDFCINDQYRSLGPALQLQRACLGAVDAEAIAFCYDFPSQPMMAVYKRLHIDPSGRMLRLSKPLRVDREVRKFVKKPAVVRGLSLVGNLFLELRDRIPRNRNTLTISLHEGNCGEEFSRLAQEVNGQYGVCVERSAAYLNWRYLANPLYNYELLTIRHEGMLLAYAIFTHGCEDTILVELFGIGNPSVIANLVYGVVALLRERGLVTVSLPIWESHPWVPLLRCLGFQVREASPVITYPYSQSTRSRFEGLDWFLMHGDRDS